MTACAAPEVNLYLFPNGEVRPCCRNGQPLGVVGAERLTDIWAGARRRELADALDRGDFSHGCEGCGVEIRLEGREHSYPAIFDPILTAAEEDPATDSGWPVRIEFNLSNLCNLQCVQCNGELSSSIRLHREGRPPLHSPYGEAFFEDLRRFIPHLHSAQFAGGEPFLAPENFRIWELVEQLNPTLACVTITNATQWNRRIERVVTRIPMGFAFSIDGISKSTYESIRVGADFDSVMSNLERYRAAAAAWNAPTSINHCLMPQNHREFGDLLLFAEERGLPVEVSVVRDPRHCSLAALPPDELRAVLDHLRADEQRVLPFLDLNAHVWRTELDRIQRWSDTPEAELSAAVSSWTTTKVTLQPLQPRILGFPIAGEHPFGDEEAHGELVTTSPDGVVHVLTVDAEDRVVGLSPSLAHLVGVTEDSLLGDDADEIRELILGAFGEIESFDVTSLDDDQLRATVVSDQVAIRLVMTAIRGDDGVAEGVRLLVAVVGDSPRPPT